MVTLDNTILPFKSKYTLIFNDQITPYMNTHTRFYKDWLEYIFEHFVDMLVSNQYLVVMVSMRDNCVAYITNLVNSGYNETVSSLMYDIMEDECAEFSDGESAYDLYNYLNDYEYAIKYNMTHMARTLVFDIFHNLYNFTLEANKYGVEFSNYHMVQTSDVTSLTIECTPTMEVIKKYDINWYDRLCMLNPF